MKILDKVKEIYLRNKEGINYLFFGGVVSLVNFITYIIFANIWSVNKITSNVIAFIISVIVAYITNKLYVFESKTKKISNIIKEFIYFILARLFSGVLCDIIMFAFMIYILKINHIITKIIIQIVIIVLNYILSKFIVFKRKDIKECTEPKKLDSIN